jgi:hypothetical protein
MTTTSQRKSLTRKLIEAGQLLSDLKKLMQQNGEFYALTLEPYGKRISKLEQMIYGGVKGHEGLLFRINFIEQLIDMKKHVRPVTKKQMVEIRRLIDQLEHN